MAASRQEPRLWPSADSLRSHERKLVVLCEPRTFADGCWAAWSWMRFVGDDLALQLFVDGPLNDEWRARFGALFPGGQIDSLPEYLARQPPPGPALGLFLGHYTYARKLSLLLALQREGDFLYADADVALFRSPDLILETDPHARRARPLHAGAGLLVRRSLGGRAGKEPGPAAP